MRLPATTTLASRWAAFNAIGAIGVVPALLIVVMVSAPAALSAQSADAQVAWTRYQACLDTRFSAETGAADFFVLDREGHAGWRETTADGSVVVAQIDAPAIPDGTLHHWVGAVFVPRATVQAVVARLEATAGRESEFYSDVVESRLTGRDGDRLRVFMKLRRTTVITVTYNTEHTVEYRRLGPSRATARSVATRIAELSEPGTPHEREKAANDDNGFLRRLNAYWRYEDWKGGVLVECESVSLSRPVPLLLRPIAGPIVDRIARESLEGTLRSLRAMLSR